MPSHTCEANGLHPRGCFDSFLNSLTSIFSTLSQTHDDDDDDDFGCKLGKPSPARGSGVDIRENTPSSSSWTLSKSSSRHASFDTEGGEQKEPKPTTSPGQTVVEQPSTAQSEDSDWWHRSFIRLLRRTQVVTGLFHTVQNKAAYANSVQSDSRPLTYAIGILGIMKKDSRTCGVLALVSERTVRFVLGVPVVGLIPTTLRASGYIGSLPEWSELSFDIADLEVVNSSIVPEEADRQLLLTGIDFPLERCSSFIRNRAEEAYSAFVIYISPRTNFPGSQKAHEVSRG